MKHKVIPVIGTGYSRDFFSIHLDDTDLSRHPHLQLPLPNEAQFAIQLDDDGFEGMSIHAGDYLLFGTTQPLRAGGQISLIRDQEVYIIREAHWNGNTTLLRVPCDAYPLLELPTENIRIVAVLDNVIRSADEVKLITFA
jgi:hypothetical protein